MEGQETLFLYTPMTEEQIAAHRQTHKTGETMTPEQSIADIDAFVQGQHNLYMLLFNIVIRHDDQLRQAVAEAIRQILVAPIDEPLLDPALRTQLQALRDSLLRPTPPKLVEAFRQPPLRPVK